MSTASPSPSRTCSAVVGDSCVNRFALGAASGNPVARSSASATGWAGIAQTDGWASPAVTMSGTDRLFGNHDGQRSRPELRGQLSGAFAPFERQFPRHPSVRHMHNQGAGMRPALCIENALYRHRVEGIGAQTVNGLRGKRDQPALAAAVRRHARSQSFQSGRIFAGIVRRLPGLAPDEPGMHQRVHGRHPARGPRRRSPALVR